MAILLDGGLKTVEILSFSMLQNLDPILVSFTHENRISSSILATSSDLEKIVLEVVHGFLFSSAFVSVDPSSSHAHFHKSLGCLLVVNFILMVHLLDLPVSSDDILHHYLLSSGCDVRFSFLSQTGVQLFLSLKTFGFIAHPIHFGLKIVHFPLCDFICLLMGSDSRIKLLLSFPIFKF